MFSNLLLFSIILIAVSCGVPSNHSTIKQELDSQYFDVVTMRGSSNTSGQGADFTFEQRLEYHLIDSLHNSMLAIT